MKKLFVIAIAIAAMWVFQAQAACVTIQQGTLVYQSGYLAGYPLQVGVDPYGYNYQAHSYNGSYFNAYANGSGLPPYNGDDTAYLSYVGSGAWLTNHNGWEVTVGKHGKQANEFIKIVAIPATAVVGAPASYFGEQTVYVDNKVMGDQLWGEFAVIQYVLNDPSNGDHGLRLKSEANAGFGFWKP